jgi:hypothetical protein
VKQHDTVKTKTYEPRQRCCWRLKRTRREEDWDSSLYPKGVLFSGSKIESDGGVITELATISPGNKHKNGGEMRRAGKEQKKCQEMTSRMIDKVS